jgi:beta-phosphoglucomutase
MDWIFRYQLFMFDFDGLLVNTEHLHFEAYRRMCAARGVDFTWDFEHYCRYAHYEAVGFREAVFKDFPALKELQPDWDVLYEEKKTALMELVRQGKTELMPGVEALLKNLEENNISRCVVTHSPIVLIESIRKQHPILNTIPHWITREEYSKPKPDSECYMTAIERHSKDNDAIIGFEDTPRGLRALMGTKATPVIVCEIEYPELPDFIEKGAKRLRNLSEIHLMDNVL